MNTAEPKYNILCYGDSNTFGSNPSGGRWGRTVRWPGRLAQLLGEDYYVIEEGFSGRTTVFDDPIVPGRSGRDALVYALTCHRPLDLVILMLGTNDTKHHFGALPVTIAKGVNELVQQILRFPYGPFAAPQVLLVSPIHVGAAVERTIHAEFGPDACEKSMALAPLYAKVAAQNGCAFLDASLFAQPSEIDQVHMDAQGHEALARAIADAVRAMKL